MPALAEGVIYRPGYFSRAEQEALVEDIRAVVAAAPLYTPQMPRSGKPMSVRMTNCGPLGWVTDRDGGYRYQAAHPVIGAPWPPMPRRLLDIWGALADYPHPPEACLVNFYTDQAKMGLHQDRDEKDFSAPVISVSLGNSCLFRVGGTTRSGKTASFRLDSGDVVMLSGPGRLCYHGVDRIYPQSSTLLKQGGRINLTLRRVTIPAAA
ncbi:alpha-ketoglutarate-dependent dioxygenase AlkB family protein [Mesorhizobium xinjiangense]|uniref:alpha-ketoglutarate-dependent dioxygenase AlkB family protein n=1 Tax=Mesorhizobium xinjiangense TaxID=2678685 RepID=UPI0012ED57AD|nr:alpha-ketoglutarate-dependent dioxygenase AlkB [Mesorhizobium xinjiangense]